MVVSTTSFTSDEISEISFYLQSNIQASILNQLLVLTDVPIDKTRVFVAIYRLITSAKNYTDNIDLKNKLSELLSSVSVVYDPILPLITNYQTSTVNIGKRRIFTRICDIFYDVNNISNINNFIDVFFLFAEKQQKFDLNKITGVDLETEEGKKLYSDLNSNN